MSNPHPLPALYPTGITLIGALPITHLFSTWMEARGEVTFITQRKGEAWYIYYAGAGDRVQCFVLISVFIFDVRENKTYASLPKMSTGTENLTKNFLP